MEPVTNTPGESLEDPKPVVPVEPETPDTPTPEALETPESPENPQANPADAVAPFSLSKEEWDTHQAEMRELKTWRAEQERVRAGQTSREQVTPTQKEWTPQEWERAEKDFGFSVAKHVGEDGKEIEQLVIDRRQMIQGILGRIAAGLEYQHKTFETMLNNQTAAARIETTVMDLEHRKESQLSDIRQYLPAMKEYLAKRIDPRSHADPGVLEDAYYWAKGRVSPEIAARAAAGAKDKGRVIHPASPKAPAKSGDTTTTPLERELMAGIPEDKWLAARSGTR